MDKITRLLNKMETAIPFADKVNIKVSSASVGWHIQHVLLATDRTANALEFSKPENYKWKFNAKRLLIFIINKIPRGKAKAPAMVQPEGDIEIKKLMNDIQKTKSKVSTLNALNSKKFIVHPYLGLLNLKQSKRFLEIHIQHHLKIINEIIDVKG